MRYAGVVLRLYWICPECGKQNGLKGTLEAEMGYIQGPAFEKVCKWCNETVEVKPVREIH